MGGWVYIMANGAHGTLYIGVTSDPVARVFAHREGRGSAFCRKYKLTRLVFAEHHDSIVDAIAREKAVKKWKRQWKLRLIRQQTPDWLDLFEMINA